MDSSFVICESLDKDWNWNISDSECRTLKAATSGEVRAELVLEKEHVNSRGSLHGAVSAALVDLLGGLSIASTGAVKTGASVDIHITYQATANVGECMEMTATCERLGRNLGFTRIEVAKQKNGQRQIVAAGTHTKFVGS